MLLRCGFLKKNKMPPLKSIKKEKFCRLIASKGISQAEAYRRTHNEKAGSYARVNASRMLTHTSIRNRIDELMEENGLSDRFLLKKGKSFLDCRRPIYFDGQKIDEAPDNPARIDAWKHLTKLKGLTEDEGQSSSVTNPVINIIINTSQAGSIGDNIKIFEQVDQVDEVSPIHQLQQLIKISPDPVQSSSFKRRRGRPRKNNVNVSKSSIDKRIDLPPSPSCLEEYGTTSPKFNEQHQIQSHD